MPALFAVCAGTLLLIWPALLNGYPLVFSDTGGLVEMGLEPYIGWDKPWVYAPFLAGSSVGQTLWGPVVAQGLLVSWALWLTAKALGLARPGLHLVLLAMLAIGSAAPWFTALLMPDVFAILVPLCIFVLAEPGRLSKAERAGAVALGTVAVAAHLAHLVVAAACVVLVLVLRGVPAWRAGTPLAAAVGLLLAINAVAYGVLAISPYGAVFGLARLVADGPGLAYIDRACPDPTLRVCAWQGRLSNDSDAFLWSPDGPLWAGDFSPVRFAPEAKRLVPAILQAYPIDALRAAALNTWRQLGMVRVGDVLTADHLDVAVLPRLVPYFPPGEIGRYEAGRQPRGLFQDAAAGFAWPHAVLLALGAAGTAAIMLLAWRSDPALAGLAALALVAALANAFATGALSGPHDRYQARIAWLVLLAPFFYAARAATSSGVMRTRPS